VVAGKTGYFVFHQKIPFPTHFDQKHLENILEILLNQYMATKNPNPPKTRNLPGIKILLKFRYVVLGVFKVKKKKHLNVTPLSYVTF